MQTLLPLLFLGILVVYLCLSFGFVSGSFSCVRHVPKCCGTQVLKVETNSEGCQDFSCDCERKCPPYFEPVCDDEGTLHSNWCHFGIAACKLEERLRVLKIAPMSHCPGMSFGPNHCFHFDEKDTLAHVVLHPLYDQAISEFIIDFTLQFSKWTVVPVFISYFAPGAGNGNELLIALRELWIGSVRIAPFPAQDVAIGEYRRFTMSVKDGQTLIYWDRKLFAKLPNQRKTLKSGGTWVLAQNQESMGGGFDDDQRFIGKICNFRMWNYGLNEIEMKEFFVNPNTTVDQMVFDNPPTYEYEMRYGARNL